MARDRVLLLGLDAADTSLLQQWMDDGSLPTLARLRSTGAWGEVTAPAGFGSGAVWPSFATGVSPARHGRYFYRQVHPGEYEARLFDEREFTARPLWDALGAEGRSVAVFDVPKVPLTTGVDGIIAVDWMTHDGIDLRAYPEQFGRELVERFGTDPIAKCDLPGGRDVAGHRLLLRQLRDRVGQRERCTLHYLAQRKWDLFLTVFAEPHCVGHQSWHVRDKRHPMHDAEAFAAIGDPVLEVYRAIDASIGRIIEHVDDHTTVIVFCGTGMGPNFTGNFVLDEVLRRIEGGAATKQVTFVRALKQRLKRVLPVALRKRTRQLGKRVEEAAKAGDRSRRRAYAVPHNDVAGAIRLNLVGREPNGIIEPAAADAYVERLRRELFALRNADSGGPVVADVVRIADHSKGEYSDQLPDLFVLWERDAPIDRVTSPSVGIVEYLHRGNRTGDHVSANFFVANGPAVCPGEVEGVTIYDFAPTVGALTGVPIDDTDGTVLGAIVPTLAYQARA